MKLIDAFASISCAHVKINLTPNPNLCEIVSEGERRIQCSVSEGGSKDPLSTVTYCWTGLCVSNLIVGFGQIG